MDTSTDFTPEQYGIMEAWLDANGYGTYDAWAADSGYVREEYMAGHPEPEGVGWMDVETGDPVDIYVNLWYAIEAEKDAIRAEVEAFRDVDLVKGNVKVTLTDIGEGYNGDYDPEDPEDAPLLRFDVYRWDGIDWEAVEDASYCTAIPVTTPRERLVELAAVIMDAVHDDVVAGISVKKTGESLSWLTA